MITEHVEALRKLAAEVGGLKAFEPGVREAIGNTNWTVLMQRLDEAEAALSPLPSSSGTGWRPMREAKHDGSIVVGRYWQMADAPNGPYPGYVLMQWDLLEDGGWMDPEGLDYIHEDVVDFLVIETRGEPLPAAPVSHGGGRGE